MLKRLKLWCKHSLSLGAAYAQILGSSVLLVFSQLGDIINNPDVKAAVGGLGLNSKWLLAFAVSGAVFALCRFRTVGKATDENNQVVTTDA